MAVPYFLLPTRVTHQKLYRNQYMRSGAKLQEPNGLDLHYPIRNLALHASRSTLFADHCGVFNHAAPSRIFHRAIGQKVPILRCKGQLPGSGDQL
jgi:hypothetical protein